MTTIKQFFFAIFLASSIGLSAQEITGNVTSSTGEGVPFTNIFLRERNIGIVSDINGHYRLPLDILENVGDTLIFSSIGFDTQQFSVAEFAEKVAAGNTDIVLTANYVLLPEVVVRPRQPRDYGFFHRRTGNAFSFNVWLNPFMRMMTFVENTSNVPKLIQTVNVGLANNNSEGIEKVRLFFYQRDENGGFQNINVGEDIFITDFSRLEIRHDVSEYHILFPAEGIYVGFEIIGEPHIVLDGSQQFALAFATTTRTSVSHLYLSGRYSGGVTEWIILQDIEGFENALIEGGASRLFRRAINGANARIGLTAH